MTATVVDAALPATLARLQGLCRDLLASAPAAASHCQRLPGRPALAWQFARGVYLHTQPCRRRAGLRHRAAADDAHGGAGLRLVLPP